MYGTVETDACPYARGFIPQELECSLASGHDRAVGVPWYKRLWRSLKGDYDCFREGLLPCGRFRDLTKEAM